MNKLLLPLMGAVLAIGIASCSGKSVTEISGGGVVSGKITGKVLNKQGVGVSGVTITIDGKSALTDATGAFAVDKISSGTHTVVPSKTGYYFLPKTQDVALTDSVTVVKYIFNADTSDFGSSGHGGTRGNCKLCHNY